MTAYERGDQPPSDPSPGFVWCPDEVVEGPLTGESVAGRPLESYAKGVIRITSDCKSCGKSHGGWMFLAYWEREKDKYPKAATFDVGRRGYCLECEQRQARENNKGRLLQSLSRLQSQWGKVKRDYERPPIARGLKAVLEELIAMVEFGPELDKYHEQLQAVTGFMSDGHP